MNFTVMATKIKDLREGIDVQAKQLEKLNSAIAEPSESNITI